jgi:hypothetical protein
MTHEKEAERNATVSVEAINAAAALAAPRVYQKAPPDFFANITEILDRALGVEWDEKSTEHLRALRDMSIGLSPGALQPRVSDAARAFLSSVGVPAPPNGWDNFEKEES